MKMFFQRDQNITATQYSNNEESHNFQIKTVYAFDVHITLSFLLFFIVVVISKFFG